MMMMIMMMMIMMMIVIVLLKHKCQTLFSNKMKAAAVMAQALQHAHTTKCGGLPGLCSNLKDYIQGRVGLTNATRYDTYSLGDLADIASKTFGMMQDLRFDANQNLKLREGETEYTVYNFREDTFGNNNFTFREVQYTTTSQRSRLRASYVN
jgi:hypothetical protein